MPTFTQMSNFINTLTSIILQLGLLALWAGLIYAAVKVWTFCFGYPDQFWELALFAVLAGAHRVQGALKLRRD